MFLVTPQPLNTAAALVRFNAVISVFSEKTQRINIRLTYREPTLPRSRVDRIGFAGLSY
jgi:hypothetical protein